jgi:hypothetical protein
MHAMYVLSNPTIHSKSLISLQFNYRVVPPGGAVLDPIPGAAAEATPSAPAAPASGAVGGGGAPVSLSAFIRSNAR